MHPCCAHREQKRVLDPLELELWIVVSHYVGAGNHIQVLCKRSQSVLLTAEPFLHPLFFEKLKNYVYELCASIYVCITQPCSAQGGQKRASELLEMELKDL